MRERMLPMNINDRKSTKSKSQSDGFRRLAEKKSPGLAVEFLEFLRHNKKWWLAPIIVFLLCLGILAILGGTGAAPFIYTLF
jgi:hypothetical protein